MSGIPVFILLLARIGLSFLTHATALHLGLAPSLIIGCFTADIHKKREMLQQRRLLLVCVSVNLGDLCHQSFNLCSPRADRRLFHCSSSCFRSFMHFYRMNI